MKYVLDTSAILSGKDFSADFQLYSTPKIVDEIAHGRMRRHLDYLLEAGLRIMVPSEKVLQEVIECAKDSGDIGRVSEADMEVLGLAKELEAVLLTDDYSIQNLASILEVRYQGIAQEGIKETFEWRFRCRGCGRYFEKMYEACPVCGSAIKTARKQ
ncbi:MAG: hypothetical protein JSW28_08990 [Thermoplasmata archaeon]|nr:MAG: hypothetical protein JSW28_08990 [Thermoplasmata archaeon]